MFAPVIKQIDCRHRVQVDHVLYPGKHRMVKIYRDDILVFSIRYNALKKICAMLDLDPVTLEPIDQPTLSHDRPQD
jgi:hypothetical protein